MNEPLPPITVPAASNLVRQSVRVGQGLIVAAFLVGIIWVAREFPLLTWAEELKQKAQSLGFLALLIIPFALALVNVLLLPGGIISLVAGYLFGVWQGWVLVLLGTTLGAAVAITITRRYARRFVEKRFLHTPRWSSLDTAIAKEGGKIVVLSQLNPLFPTSLINYLYGATCIKFWPCLGWIAIGQSPGLLLYAYLGSLGDLGVQWMRGTLDLGWQGHAIWISGLLFSLGLTWALGRLAMRLWKTTSAHIPPTEESTKAVQPSATEPAQP